MGPAYIILKSLAYQPFEKADYSVRKEILTDHLEVLNVNKTKDRTMVHACGIPSQENAEALQETRKGKKADSGESQSGDEESLSDDGESQ